MLSDNTINLFIVRHGDAEPKTDLSEDYNRKLTKKGIKQLKRVANFLDKMDHHIENVISSPLIRAYQSADIIVDELKMNVKIEKNDNLKPEADVTNIIPFLKELKDNAIIVGHDPNVSLLLNKISGTNGKIKKGGIAFLKFDKDNGTAELELLLDQKVLKLM